MQRCDSCEKKKKKKKKRVKLKLYNKKLDKARIRSRRPVLAMATCVYLGSRTFSAGLTGLCAMKLRKNMAAVLLARISAPSKATVHAQHRVTGRLDRKLKLSVTRQSSGV